MFDGNFIRQRLFRFKGQIFFDLRPNDCLTHMLSGSFSGSHNCDAAYNLIQFLSELAFIFNSEINVLFDVKILDTEEIMDKKPKDKEAIRECFRLPKKLGIRWVPIPAHYPGQDKLFDLKTPKNKHLSPVH